MYRLATMVSWHGAGDVDAVRRLVELRPELAVDGVATAGVATAGVATAGVATAGVATAGVATATLPGVAMAAACRAAAAGELLPNQPYSHGPGITVIADARLDNRRELTDALDGQGTPLRGDAHVIARGYERWGADVTRRLEGDFAFVLWDAAEGRLLAARDGMGVRPLYFAEHAGALWVASEVEQLLLVPGLPHQLDDGAVLDYLTWDAQHVDNSMFAAIRRLPAGHQLLASAGTVRRLRFWSPRDELGYRPPADVADELRAALGRSVEARLQSSHPVLVHLSGGLDSSSITCVAERTCAAGSGPSGGCVAVSAVFPGMECDESPYIEAVASSLRTVEHETWDGRIAEWLDLDAPTPGWPGARVAFAGGATGDLRIAARRGARVLLCGEFGDEIFHDQAVLPELAARQRWMALLDETLGAVGQPWSWRLGELKRSIGALAPASVRRWRTAHRADQQPPPWLPDGMRPLWAARVQARLSSARDRRQPAAEQVADLLCSPAILKLVDFEQRYAAGGGMEMRFPFLSRRVIRLALSLSLEQRRPLGRRRGWQRRALAGVLPRPLLERSKTAFVQARIRQGQETLPRLAEMLASPVWSSERHVARNGLRRMLERMERRGDGASWREWLELILVANLESWNRKNSEGHRS